MNGQKWPFSCIWCKEIAQNAKHPQTWQLARFGKFGHSLLIHIKFILLYVASSVNIL